MSTSTGASAGAPLLQSINAGHTWSARAIASGNPSNSGAVNGSSTYNNMDSYAGTTVVTMSARLTTVSTTKDDGLNWTTVNPGIGAIHSLAARNT
jgi:hypothetical protein